MDKPSSGVHRGSSLAATLCLALAGCPGESAPQSEGSTSSGLGVTMTGSGLGTSSGTAETADTTGGLPASAGTPWVWELPEGFPPPYVPADNPLTLEKVELGRHLFYDPRLSVNGTMSCETCHRQAQGFADGRSVPLGSEGTPLLRNAAGLANIGYLYPLTWANPLLETLEEQVLVPLLSQEPVELGIAGHEEEIFARLRSDGRYPVLFGHAFPGEQDAFTTHHIAQALASFLRVLVSLDAPYDRYYYGEDATALSESAKRGASLFFSERLECHHCHGGFAQTQAIRHARTAHPPLSWHNIGLYNLDAEGAYPFGNRGVYEITLDPKDMGAFRPPSLRNVAVTGPYMHDGSVETLEEVLQIYERGGRLIESGPLAGDGSQNPHKSGFLVGFELTEDERDDVLAFLDALTDETFLADPRWSNPWVE